MGSQSPPTAPVVDFPSPSPLIPPVISGEARIKMEPYPSYIRPASSLLLTDIEKLHSCPTSALKHSLEKYFQIQVAEAENFTKLVLIEILNRIPKYVAVDRRAGGRRLPSKIKKNKEEEKYENQRKSIFQDEMLHAGNIF